MDQPFRGKTVLVTGAASGVGKATAILYGKLDANVVSDLHEPPGLETVKAIQQQVGRFL